VGINTPNRYNKISLFLPSDILVRQRKRRSAIFRRISENKVEFWLAAEIAGCSCTCGSDQVKPGAYVVLQRAFGGIPALIRDTDNRPRLTIRSSVISRASSTRGGLQSEWVQATATSSRILRRLQRNDSINNGRTRSFSEDGPLSLMCLVSVYEEGSSRK
jgi:hypothetical protein